MGALATIINECLGFAPAWFPASANEHSMHALVRDGWRWGERPWETDDSDADAEENSSQPDIIDQCVSSSKDAHGEEKIVDNLVWVRASGLWRTWEDQIILHTLLMYLATWSSPTHTPSPIYMETRRSQPHGSLALLHADPVELLYYWFYRARHDSTTTSSTLATILTTTPSSIDSRAHNVYEFLKPLFSFIYSIRISFLIISIWQLWCTPSLSISPKHYFYECICICWTFQLLQSHSSWPTTLCSW